MPSHYTLRMQFGTHQDPDMITRQLLKLIKSAPIDEIMFFYFAEEMNNGHDTLDEIREWIEHSRPYRKAVADAGIVVSLNPWHCLLHTDRHRVLKPGQNWRTMVDPNGREATAVVCPLDKNWRKYYDESMRLYAKEDFRVIWVDDDLRLHNHGDLEWGGCFCEEHVAEFNKRAGVNASREEIVAACTAPGEPHPWRALWMDMWEATQLAIVNDWRKIVEAEGCKLGIMSSSFEAHAAEGRHLKDWWKAFGGDGAPVNRPHFWGYSDMMGPDLIAGIANLDINRRLQPPNIESGPEIECFTYGRWNKSFTQTGAQMACAHILGSTNLNISIYDFMGNDPDYEPERADFLREWRPALDWIADEIPMTYRSYGVGVPFDENIGRNIRTDGSGKWASLMCKPRGWANWLGAFGQAFSMAPSSKVNALAGAMTWSFSDEDLREWLSSGLLLDGEAAVVLIERGFGDLIGVKSGGLITQADVLYSVENCINEDFAIRQGAQMSVNTTDHLESYSAKLFQGDLMDGVIIASDLRGPRQDVVGHGLVLFENELGGRVAIVPWSANGRVAMNIQRATQMRKVTSYLSRGVSLGSATGGPWLVPQFMTDGESWRGVVWNASPDDVDKIVVSVPKEMKGMADAVHVDSHGNRRAAKIDGAAITLDRPMNQWEFVLFSASDG